MGRAHRRAMQAGRSASDARSAFALLLASEARRRSGTYAFLVVVFLLATASLGVILGSVHGVMDGVGGELRETLTSDHRLVLGDPANLGGGRLFEGADGVAARLASASGARIAPRLEVQGVLLHADTFEEFDSGLLVGIDPRLDARVSAAPERVTAGRWIDAPRLWSDGTPYTQLVVGEDMLRALGMTVHREGEPVLASSLLNVTAGRFAAEGGDVRPVVRTGVVVGTFATGFNPVDRRTVYLHIDATRELLRAQFDHESANLLLAAGGDAHALSRAAEDEGFSVASARDFRDHYLSAVIAPLRAFTALVTLVVLLLCAGWVAHVVAAAVLSDRRRIAVLRALGVPSRLIVGPIALLLLLCAAAGVALGLVISFALAGTLGAVDVRVPGLARGLRMALPLVTAGLIAAGVLLSAAASAGGAGVALRRIAPAEALRE